MDAHGFQRFTGLDGLVSHQTVGNDGDIRTLAHDLALADLEFETVLMEHRNCQAPHAQIDRTLIFIRRLGGRLGFHAVGGADDDHAGDGTHQRKVLAALVARAVLAHGQAAVGSADLHIQVGIADGVADLLESPPRGEHGKGRREGNEAVGREACRHAHHVRFRDAAVEVTVGVRLGKHAGLCGACQVGVQHHDVLMRRAQSNQSPSVALAGGHFLYICHITCPPDCPAAASAPP